MPRADGWRRRTTSRSPILPASRRFLRLVVARSSMSFVPICEDAHGAGRTHLLPSRGRAREAFQDVGQRARLARRDAGGGVEHAAETVQQLDPVRVAERDQLRGAFALRGTVATDPMGSDEAKTREGPSRQA
jgi:hypothetical protein